MKNKAKSLRSVRFAFVASCIMIGASTSKAALIYHVDIDTTSLVGSLNGPFSLDFQLTDGSGTLAGVNTVTLDNFMFTGGTPTGSASLFGGATGSLSSIVTLTDNASFSNEFFQGFSAGTTKIGFDALLTTNVDPGPTPDAFSMAILDNTLSNIPATGPGDSLMLVNINSPSLSLSAVQKFTSTSPSGVTVAASPTPEPSSWLVMGSGLLALGGLALRRNIKGGAGKTA
jgi:hypothetical protein